MKILLKIYATVFCMLICLRGTVWSLKLKVHVPHYKQFGEMALLECKYDLEGVRLYSVKWYKDNEEFYRFLPRSSPNKTKYTVEGVQVELSLSDSKEVALKNVALKSSGTYRCEVNTERPSFASVNGQGTMMVVYLPKNGPEITGEDKEKYQTGDMLDVNCTSGKSYPYANLAWYINDYSVSPSSLVHYEPILHHNGLLTSTLGLRFRLHPNHFQGGHLKVKCLATITTVFWQGDRESVLENQPLLQQQQKLPEPLIDNREAMLLVTGCSSSTSSAYLLLLFSTFLSVIHRYW